MQYVSVLFVVLSSSGGTPPLRSSASTTVYVNLLDLNDNDPAFLNLPFVAEVPEGLPIGSSVFRVSIWLVEVSTGSRSHWLNIQQAKTSISFNIQGDLGSISDFKMYFWNNPSKTATELDGQRSSGILTLCKLALWWKSHPFYPTKWSEIKKNIIILCFRLITLRFKNLGQ